MICLYLFILNKKTISEIANSLGFLLIIEFND